MEAFFRQNASRQTVADLQETSSIQQLEKVFDQPNERQEITSDIMHKLNTIQVSKFECIFPLLLEYIWCMAQMFQQVVLLFILPYGKTWPLILKF